METRAAVLKANALQKNGGTLLNKINSIAKTNPTYAQQLQHGYDLLKSIGYKSSFPKCRPRKRRGRLRSVMKRHLIRNARIGVGVVYAEPNLSVIVDAAAFEQHRKRVCRAAAGLSFRSGRRSRVSLAREARRAALALVKRAQSALRPIADGLEWIDFGKERVAPLIGKPIHVARTAQNSAEALPCVIGIRDRPEVFRRAL